MAYAAALITVVAFGIYLRTMMPSVGFWDTGEAQTVPPTLSIFHPTGFPVYAMLGWLWSHIPFGEVAWRMNLLSGVCVAVAAGLVVLIAGHLIAERRPIVRATAAGIAGAAFGFASEPWQNATRADVHALNVLLVALVVWLLFTWAAAERAGARQAGGWLAAAAFTFGLGLGAHPLIGMLAFGIAAWLLVVDRHLWRRWRLWLLCAGLLAVGIATYAYIPLRAVTDPEPPLFYARPDTWERFRYLVFAEQFESLFDEFSTPLADLGAKWRDAERVLSAQFVAAGWLVVAVGAAVLGARRIGALVFLALVAAADVVYAMNFRDGDIDRYYLPVLVVTAPLIGVALATIAVAGSRAVVQVAEGISTRRGRRVLAAGASVLVLGLGIALPFSSLVAGYAAQDQSDNHEADRWVESVHAQLPPNSVIVSWWSYSTPLWHHRWVLGERPDITIIDERNILDDGYRTMHNAIRAHLDERPVFVVPPDWEYRRIIDRWEVRTVQTYPGYTDLLRIEGPSG